jgi:predicted branched-subunit amino acid permease
VGLSTIVFAGAAQLAAIDLMARDAALVVIVLTALVINARMLMYSASLAPHFAGLDVRRRMGAAYVLTDQAYAVSIFQYDTGLFSLRERLAYYLGAGLTLWSVWQVVTLIGALAGRGLPEGLSLEFGVPLVFLALLVPALRTRPSVVAALAAGTVAVAAAGFPYNSGLLVGAGAGIAAGLLAGLRREAAS